MNEMSTLIVSNSNGEETPFEIVDASARGDINTLTVTVDKLNEKVGEGVYDDTEIKGEITELKSDLNDLLDVTKSVNRWNPNNLYVGRIDVNTGEVDETYTKHNVSDFVEATDIYACMTVTEDDYLTATIVYDRIAQYRADKTFIKSSYGGTTPILLDEDCKFVRFSIHNSQRNVCAYFNSDGSAIAYTPYFDDIKKVKPSYISCAYKGKKMCTLGDSITNHETWQSTVVDILGLSGFQNCGVSGSMISGSASTSFHQDDRVNAISEDCDFIVIMGGVNDATGRAVGDMTLDNHSPYPVFGALNLLISKLYYKARINEGYYSDVDYSGVTRFSKRKEFPIFLATQPMHTQNDIINEDNYNEIENAIRKCGELWGIPVIDVERKSGLNKLTMAISDYSADGLHLTSYGGKLLGTCIATQLKNNEPYFG